MIKKNDLQKAVFNVFGKVFVGAPANSITGERRDEDNKVPLTAFTMQDMLKRGLVWDEKVQYVLNENSDLRRTIFNLYPTNDQMNSSLFASSNESDLYKIVKTLIMYITGENIENKGPIEDVKVEEFKQLQSIDYFELLEEISKFLKTALNINNSLFEDWKLLIDWFIDQDALDEFLVNSIKSNEIKIFIYKTMGLIPNNPDDYIRYLIFLATRKPLKIKSKEVLFSLEDLEHPLINKIELEVEQIAESYNRNKDFWLSLKNGSNRRIINRAAKLSKKLHKPVRKSMLDNIMEYRPCSEELVKLLKNKDFGGVVKIFKFIKTELLTTDSNRLYRIRNGSSWVKEIEDRDKLYLLSIYKGVKSLLEKRVA